jgi:3-oxocholest-4-en-26-oyl-CoA dehydrogenase alpha subunit
MNDYRAEYHDRVRSLLDQTLTAAELHSVWDSGTLHHAGLAGAMAAEGWIGASWPISAGGAGMRADEYAALWEALNYHMVPTDLIQITEILASVVQIHGTDEQRNQVLPGVLRGELLMSMGYTEPEAGSDVAATRTSAVRDDDGWRINGAKMFTTGAHRADLILTLTRTDPERGKHAGLSLFLVPTSAPGVQVSPVHTFGGDRTNAVFFDDVHVGDGALVGSLNEGWLVLNQALDVERLFMGAFVGQAQRLLDELVAAAETRANATSGQEAVDKIAEVASRVAASQAIVASLYGRIAAGEDVHEHAAMAKLLVTETVKELTYLALDVLGPEALLERSEEDAIADGLLEHWFRHSQVLTIYGGSSEIQRNIVAGRYLGLPRG